MRIFWLPPSGMEVITQTLAMNGCDVHLPLSTNKSWTWEDDTSSLELM